MISIEPIGKRPQPKPQQQPASKPCKIILEMEQRLNLNCSICSYTYNISTKIPKIICRRQHTYCSECVAMILRARPLRCPQCRFRIFEENIFINRALYTVCQFFPILKKEVSELVDQNNNLKNESQKLTVKMEQLKTQKDKMLQNIKVGEKMQQSFIKQVNNMKLSKHTVVTQSPIRVKYNKIQSIKPNPQSIKKEGTKKKSRIIDHKSMEKQQNYNKLFPFHPIIRNYKHEE